MNRAKIGAAYNRTIQKELFAVTFRKKIYENLESLQKDFDEWLSYYNDERAHSGRCSCGKTPMQTFTESIILAKQKMLDHLPPAA